LQATGLLAITLELVKNITNDGELLKVGMIIYEEDTPETIKT
jgi:hypothetical protein